MLRLVAENNLVPTPVIKGDELVVLILNNDLSVHLSVSALIAWGTLVIAIAFMGVRIFGRFIGLRGSRSFEIEEAEFGLGDQKITMRPNDTDRQIAYKIWVELSTRKIGLPIEVEHDVIAEIYDSWFNFFSVTRELIKDIPVTKFRRRDTEKIVRLSIEVLNLGIRPHLTEWQARFRRWYTRALEESEFRSFSPQEVQQKFPQYAALVEDLQKVNRHLIRYREKMYALVTTI